MKIPRLIRVTALITCCIFSFTTISNAAPRVARDAHSAKSIAQRVNHSMPNASSPLPAQALGAAQDLAPQPLSQVLQRLTKLLSGIDDPIQKQRAIDQITRLFTKDAEGQNSRTRALADLINDPAQREKLGLTEKVLRTLIDETQSSEISINTTTGEMQAESVTLDDAVAKTLPSEPLAINKDKGEEGSTKLTLLLAVACITILVAGFFHFNRDAIMARFTDASQVSYMQQDLHVKSAVVGHIEALTNFEYLDTDEVNDALVATTKPHYLIEPKAQELLRVYAQNGYMHEVLSALLQSQEMWVLTGYSADNSDQQAYRSLVYSLVSRGGMGLMENSALLLQLCEPLLDPIMSDDVARTMSSVDIVLLRDILARLADDFKTFPRFPSVPHEVVPSPFVEQLQYVALTHTTKYREDENNAPGSFFSIYPEVDTLMKHIATEDEYAAFVARNRGAYLLFLYQLNVWGENFSNDTNPYRQFIPEEYRARKGRVKLRKELVDFTGDLPFHELLKLTTLDDGYFVTEYGWKMTYMAYEVLLQRFASLNEDEQSTLIKRAAFLTQITPQALKDMRSDTPLFYFSKENMTVLQKMVQERASADEEIEGRVAMMEPDVAQELEQTDRAHLLPDVKRIEAVKQKTLFVHKLVYKGRSFQAWFDDYGMTDAVQGHAAYRASSEALAKMGETLAEDTLKAYYIRHFIRENIARSEASEYRWFLGDIADVILPIVRTMQSDADKEWLVDFLKQFFSHDLFVDGDGDSHATYSAISLAGSIVQTFDADALKVKFLAYLTERYEIGADREDHPIGYWSPIRETYPDVVFSIIDPALRAESLAPLLASLYLQDAYLNGELRSRMIETIGVVTQNINIQEFSERVVRFVAPLVSAKDWQTRSAAFNVTFALAFIGNDDMLKLEVLDQYLKALDKRHVGYYAFPHNFGTKMDYLQVEKQAHTAIRKIVYTLDSMTARVMALQKVRGLFKSDDPEVQESAARLYVTLVRICDSQSQEIGMLQMGTDNASGVARILIANSLERVKVRTNATRTVVHLVDLLKRKSTQQERNDARAEIVTFNRSVNEHILKYLDLKNIRALESIGVSRENLWKMHYAAVVIAKDRFLLLSHTQKEYVINQLNETFHSGENSDIKYIYLNKKNRDVTLDVLDDEFSQTVLLFDKVGTQKKQLQKERPQRAPERTYVITDAAFPASASNTSLTGIRLHSSIATSLCLAPLVDVSPMAVIGIIGALASIFMIARMHGGAWKEPWLDQHGGAKDRTPYREPWLEDGAKPYFEREAERLNENGVKGDTDGAFLARMIQERKERKMQAGLTPVKKEEELPFEKFDFRKKNVTRGPTLLSVNAFLASFLASDLVVMIKENQVAASIILGLTAIIGFFSYRALTKKKRLLKRFNKHKKYYAHFPSHFTEYARELLELYPNDKKVVEEVFFSSFADEDAAKILFEMKAVGSFERAIDGKGRYPASRTLLAAKALIALASDNQELMTKVFLSGYETEKSFALLEKMGAYDGIVQGLSSHDAAIRSLAAESFLTYMMVNHARNKFITEPYEVLVADSAVGTSLDDFYVYLDLSKRDLHTFVTIFGLMKAYNRLDVPITEGLDAFDALLQLIEWQETDPDDKTALITVRLADRVLSSEKTQKFMTSKFHEYMLYFLKQVPAHAYDAKRTALRALDIVDEVVTHDFVHTVVSEADAHKSYLRRRDALDDETALKNLKSKKPLFGRVLSVLLMVGVVGFLPNFAHATGFSEAIDTMTNLYFSDQTTFWIYAVSGIVGLLVAIKVLYELLFNRHWIVRYPAKSAPVKPVYTIDSPSTEPSETDQKVDELLIDLFGSDNAKAKKAAYDLRFIFTHDVDDALERASHYPELAQIVAETMKHRRERLPDLSKVDELVPGSAALVEERVIKGGKLSSGVPLSAQETEEIRVYGVILTDAERQLVLENHPNAPQPIGSQEADMKRVTTVLGGEGDFARGSGEKDNSLLRSMPASSRNTLLDAEVFAFDMSGTLKIDDAMIATMADLLNAGKRVVINTGNKVDKITRWVEGVNGLAARVHPDKRYLFNAYCDHLTRVYEIGVAGKLREIDTIAFPSDVNKNDVVRIINANIVRIRGKVATAGLAVSMKIKRIIADNQIRAKIVGDYIEVTSDVKIKGDETAVVARAMLRDLLVRAVASEGIDPLLMNFALEGSRGVFVKHLDASKDGSLRHVMKTFGVAQEKIVYIANEFAGKATVDLPVAEMGIASINVGDVENTDLPNVTNLGGGPATTLQLVQEVAAVKMQVKKQKEKGKTDSGFSSLQAPSSKLQALLIPFFATGLVLTGYSIANAANVSFGLFSQNGFGMQFMSVLGLGVFSVSVLFGMMGPREAMGHYKILRDKEEEQKRLGAEWQQNQQDRHDRQRDQLHSPEPVIIQPRVPGTDPVSSDTHVPFMENTKQDNFRTPLIEQPHFKPLDQDKGVAVHNSFNQDDLDTPPWKKWSIVLVFAPAVLLFGSVAIANASTGGFFAGDNLIQLFNVGAIALFVSMVPAQIFKALWQHARSKFFVVAGLTLVGLLFFGYQFAYAAGDAAVVATEWTDLWKGVGISVVAGVLLSLVFHKTVKYFLGKVVTGKKDFFIKEGTFDEYLNYGKWCRFLEHNDAAIDSFTKAIAENQASSEPHYELAKLYDRLGRPDLALPHYHRATFFVNGYTKIKRFIEYAGVLEKEGRLPAALDALMEAYNTDPQSIEAISALHSYYRSRRDKVNSDKFLKKLEAYQDDLGARGGLTHSTSLIHHFFPGRDKKDVSAEKEIVVSGSKKSNTPKTIAKKKKKVKSRDMYVSRAKRDIGAKDDTVSILYQVFLISFALGLTVLWAVSMALISFFTVSFAILADFYDRMVARFGRSEPQVKSEKAKGKRDRHSEQSEESQRSFGKPQDDQTSIQDRVSEDSELKTQNSKIKTSLWQKIRKILKLDFIKSIFFLSVPLVFVATVARAGDVPEALLGSGLDTGNPLAAPLGIVAAAMIVIPIVSGLDLRSRRIAYLQNKRYESGLWPFRFIKLDYLIPWSEKSQQQQRMVRDYVIAPWLGIVSSMRIFFPWLSSISEEARKQKKAIEFIQQIEAMEPAWHTEKTVIRENAYHQLLDFSAAGYEIDETHYPMVVVPPNAGHTSAIADFAENKSMVQSYLREKTPVYAINWKTADPNNIMLISDMVQSVVDAIDTVGGKAQLSGLCQGGWLSLLVAELYPEKVVGLHLNAAPVDTKRGDNDVTRISEMPQWLFQFHVFAYGEDGIYDGDTQNEAFYNMGKSDGRDKKQEMWDSLLEIIDDPVALKKNTPFWVWFLRTQSLSYYFLEATEFHFGENQIFDETYESIVGNELRVPKLSHYTGPVVLYEGTEDDVTAPATIEKIDVVPLVEDAGAAWEFLKRSGLISDASKNNINRTPGIKGVILPVVNGLTRAAFDAIDDDYFKTLEIAEKERLFTLLKDARGQTFATEERVGTPSEHIKKVTLQAGHIGCFNGTKSQDPIRQGLRFVQNIIGKNSVSKSASKKDDGLSRTLKSILIFLVTAGFALIPSLADASTLSNTLSSGLNFMTTLYFADQTLFWVYAIGGIVGILVAIKIMHELFFNRTFITIYPAKTTPPKPVYVSTPATASTMNAEHTLLVENIFNSDLSIALPAIFDLRFVVTSDVDDALERALKYPELADAVRETMAYREARSKELSSLTPAAPGSAAVKHAHAIKGSTKSPGVPLSVEERKELRNYGRFLSDEERAKVAAHAPDRPLTYDEKKQGLVRVLGTEEQFSEHIKIVRKPNFRTRKPKAQSSTITITSSPALHAEAEDADKQAQLRHAVSAFKDTVSVDMREELDRSVRVAMDADLSRLALYRDDSEMGHIAVSPVALRNNLVFTGELAHEFIHHVLMRTELGQTIVRKYGALNKLTEVTPIMYSKKLQDLIATVIQLRVMAKNAFQDDLRLQAEGAPTLPFGTTLNEAIRFLNDDATGLTDVAKMHLKHMLNHFRTVEGGSLEKQIAVVQELLMLKTYAAEEYAYLTPSDISDLTAFISEIERTVFASGDQEILYNVMGDLVLENNEKSLVRAARVLPASRAVLLDNIELKKLDLEVLRNLVDDNHPLYMREDSMVYQLIITEELTVKRLFIDPFEVTDLTSAVNYVAAKGFQVTVISRSEDKHDYEKLYTRDDVLIFSTAYAYEALGERVPDLFSLEAVVFPYAFTMNKDDLVAHAGVSRAFHANGKVFALNPDYVANFGDTIHKSLDRIMTSIKNAVAQIAIDRAIQIAA